MRPGWPPGARNGSRGGLGSVGFLSAGFCESGGKSAGSLTSEYEEEKRGRRRSSDTFQRGNPEKHPLDLIVSDVSKVKPNNFVYSEFGFATDITASQSGNRLGTVMSEHLFYKQLKSADERQDFPPDIRSQTQLESLILAQDERWRQA